MFYYTLRVQFVLIDNSCRLRKHIYKMRAFYFFHQLVVGMAIDVLDREPGFVRAWSGAGLGREIYNPQNSGPCGMGFGWYRTRCGTAHCEPRDALDPACLSSFAILPLHLKKQKEKNKQRKRRRCSSPHEEIELRRRRFDVRC